MLASSSLAQNNIFNRVLILSLFPQKNLFNWKLASFLLALKNLLHKTSLDEAFVFPGEDEIEVVMTAARGVADQKGFLTMQV